MPDENRKPEKRIHEKESEKLDTMDGSQMTHRTQTRGGSRERDDCRQVRGAGASSERRSQ